MYEMFLNIGGVDKEIFCLICDWCDFCYVDYFVFWVSGKEVCFCDRNGWFCC